MIVEKPAPSEDQAVDPPAQDPAPEPAPSHPGLEALRTEMGPVKRVMKMGFRSAFAQQIVGSSVEGVEIGSSFLFKTDGGLGLLPTRLLADKLGGVPEGGEITPDDPSFGSVVSRMGATASALIEVLMSGTPSSS